MSFITRKPVFGISDQVRLKLACSVTEASQRLEISYTETRDIILSRQQTTKLLAYAKSMYSHGKAHVKARWENEQLGISIYLKTPKFSDTQEIAVIIVTFE